ncbi:helix-turn-helix domain-containing protein [Paracoccus sp. Z330]|uniref:Helix-turn-helix domain-containing protein n=1 Tax=Paracoccus onchidii TaxID=3017813 RepID=A0ABT4ZJT6_9RHOB|nr:helix-turn-helix domain-containing protein [Paracoccus onchidii]MDB6179624.1 helix-turn-helix domain-containing protein [Paracoccus onchidii]
MTTALDGDDRLLKPKDAAAFIGVSETTLRRLYNEGVIPRVRVTEDRAAYRFGDLRAFITSRPVEHGGALG